MRAFIGVVQDVFQITRWGCVVAHAPPADPDLRVRVGDGILLRRPDGSEITTSKSSEILGNRNPAIESLSLAGVHKDDIPIGTEIWLI